MRTGSDVKSRFNSRQIALLLGNLPRTQIYLVCHSRTTRKAKTVLRMRTGSDVKSRFNSLSVARQPPPNPNISRLSL